MFVVSDVLKHNAARRDVETADPRVDEWKWASWSFFRARLNIIAIAIHSFDWTFIKLDKFGVSKYLKLITGKSLLTH